MNSTQDNHQQMFNYSLVIRTLLPLLCGVLRFHASIISAAAGCKLFWDDSSRYIVMNGTKSSTYLSDMKKAKRNAPEAIRLLFRTGSYNDIQHMKPSAERFKDVVYRQLTFIHEDDELVFRDTIRSALKPENNPHMKQKEINALLESCNKDDIETFIFNCIYQGIISKGNDVNKRIYKSDTQAAAAEANQSVAAMTECEKESYRIQNKEV